MSATTTYQDLPWQTMDAMYVTWTGDPTLAPWTEDVHIPFVLFTACHVLALFLTTVCVCLRLYTRRFVVRQVGYDDWVLLAAQLIDFDPLVGTLSTVTIRAAIACFFLRVVPAFSHPGPRWAIIITLSLYTAYMVAYMFFDIFQCGNPTAKGYEAFMTEVCVEYSAQYALPFVARLITVLLDWFMTLVPVVLVLRSNMRLPEKISTIAILCLAGAGSILALLSMVLTRYSELSWPSDEPHANIYTIIRTFENASGIIVVSLAGMRPLFVRLHERYSRDRSGATGGQSGEAARPPSFVHQVEVHQVVGGKEFVTESTGRGMSDAC
ncbi:hypothetical protein ANO11243_010290 [Dothideomycetidae sp. 11243]|nr:hypothetical protein ANO11243_010290 [fungal sp. No.11243]